ncbi:MAG: RagB/SusD family nutrient uptake outer membrane protein [Bacteroidales bacterium]|nr:RagB/SusD family nutrient uptake outer membrane protein [Bacteroidales bacterium]
MKKYISVFAVGALAMLSVTSCDGLLNKAPLDSFADSNYWTSEANVEVYANTFFNNFIGYGNQGGSGSYYFPTLNDNQCGAGFVDWNYNNVLTVNTAAWNDPYTEIRRANIMLARLEGMNLSETAKAHWTGVARLMRGLQYYWLVRTFGDVPLVDRELSVSDEAVFGPRTDRDLVMDFALEDLNYAVSNIKDVATKTSWSRNLAQAIKSEVCLYEGTYSKYRVAADGQKAPDATRANKYLTESKTASSALMAKFNTLNASYQANYNSLDLADNPEMIFYKHYVKDLFMHSLPDYTCSSSQQYGMTKDAFNAYLFTDGKPKASTTLDNTDVPATLAADGIHLDLTPLLAVRDPRLAASVDKVVMPVSAGFKGRLGRSDDVEMTSSTGYGVFKFDSAELADGYRVETGKNYTDAPLYWLSVIYLNYAEACAELGSCTQTDLDNSVNKLRDRVHMPHMVVSPAADPANNMGVSALIWEIRRERRVELMYDGNFRFWDLMRWHQLDKLDTHLYLDVKLGANLSNAASQITDEVTVDDDGYIIAYPNHDRIYESKYYAYPIPTSQIAINKALTQNEGWK